jgi:hypothetical protein
MKGIKKLGISGIISVFLFLPCVVIDAREREDSTRIIRRNYIIGNLSFLDININYERNIIHLPQSHTNIRIGLGAFNDLQGGGTEYVATLVNLFGKRNSHLELNLGLKYIVNSKDNANPTVKSFLTDMFAGYRFEMPGNSFVFRIGFIYPEIYAIAVGIGAKF